MDRFFPDPKLDDRFGLVVQIIIHANEPPL
jgi:hypothetical protein